LASELSKTVSTEGANQKSTGTCTDNAGNDATDTQDDIDIDKTKPTITYVSRSQPAGAWTNQDVNLVWSCTDNTNGSGVNHLASELSKTVSTEGENQDSTGTCIDNAGNDASDTVIDIDIDKTKPVVSSDVSVAGSDGEGDWYTSDVEVTFTGTDALSGLPSATQKATSSGQGIAVQVQSPAFTDRAGNSSNVGVVTKSFQIDKEAPTVGDAAIVSGTLGKNGWYQSDVTVSFTATDNVSGVVGDRTRNVTSAQQGAGIVLDSPEFSDVAGNVREAGNKKSATFKVDSLAPTVSLLNGPVAGSTYVFGTVPAAPTCGASDATPGSGLVDADDTATGVQDCVVTGYSTSVGPHTVHATATDNAGNSTTVSRTYTVGAWTVNGFYAPVDKGIHNTIKGGATVPLKFELFAGSTELTDVSAVDSFVAQRVTCDTGLGSDSVETTSTLATSLRYDTTGGQFIQNWKTPAGAGNCYRVTLTAKDGVSTISALFKTK
jgi:hypothetical protein